MNVSLFACVLSVSHLICVCLFFSACPAQCATFTTYSCETIVVVMQSGLAVKMMKIVCDGIFFLLISVFKIPPKPDVFTMFNILFNFNSM